MTPPAVAHGRTRRGATLRRVSVCLAAACLLPPPAQGRAAPGPASAAPLPGALAGAWQERARPDDPGTLLMAGVALVEAGELDRAGVVLADALRRWPDHPGLLAGLAGIRLQQGRPVEAEALALHLTRVDPAPAHGWELLAASRYLQDDVRGALRAWRHHRSPVVRDLQVRVLAHDGSRGAAPAKDPTRLTGISGGRPLTVEGLVRGERRLGALPAASRSRLAYRALSEGGAALEGTVVLGADNPFTAPGLAAHALRLAVRRVRIVSSDPLGRLERWELSGRVEGTLRSAEFALTHLAPLASGVWRWSLEHETGRFGQGERDEPRSEGRTGVAWSHADWVAASLLGAVHGRVDFRPGRGTFAGAGLEWTLLSLTGRSSLRLEGTGWTKVGGSGSGLPDQASHFGRLDLDAALHPPDPTGGTAPSGLSLRGGAVAVSAGAPRDLSPRIGAGGNVSLLMRARSDLDGEGAVRPLFPGRAWAHGGIEVLHPAGSVGPVSIGLAAFADGVRVLGPSPSVEGRRGAVHLGMGLRLRMALVPGWLRADWGVDPVDGSSTTSFAWVPGASSWRP